MNELTNVPQCDGPLPNDAAEPITAEIRDVIEKATAVIGSGKGMHWASLETHVARPTLFSYRRDYAEYWQMCLDRAEQADRERREADLTGAIRDRIRKATELIAGGAKIAKAAKTLQISFACLMGYRTAYKDFWHECLTEARHARRTSPKKLEPNPDNAGPSENVIRNIAEATRHVAAGKTLREAAKAMGDITHGTLSYYRKTHPGLWKAGMEAAGGTHVTVPVNTNIRPRTLEKIGVAARMISQGHTMKEVAEQLGVTPQSIGFYARQYPVLWEAALDEAGRHCAELVKQVSGTAGVLDDPAGFWKAACAAEKWAGRHGVDLFPADGKTTLCTFYRDYYESNILPHNASQSWRKLLEISLKRWKLITGDPPLEEIDNALLARFRDFLFKCRSMGRGEHLAPATVANYMKNVQVVLQKAGPPAPRNRDAAGILDRVPWARLPRIQRKIPQIVNEQTLGRMYDGCDIAVTPRIPGVKPPDWWRGLLVVVWITAARRRTLFELEWSDYHPARNALVVPGERFKNGRPHVLPLTDLAIEHLERIRTDRRLIFEWPSTMEAFHRLWRQLQWEAGIPRSEKFGLHAIRRTAITRLAKHSLAAAQLLGGHHSVDVTVGHYIDPNPIVSEAIRSMPDPEAFGRHRTANGTAQATPPETAASTAQATPPVSAVPTAQASRPLPTPSWLPDRAAGRGNGHAPIDTRPSDLSRDGRDQVHPRRSDQADDNGNGYPATGNGREAPYQDDHNQVNRPRPGGPVYPKELGNVDWLL